MNMHKPISRRTFVTTMTQAAGTSLLLATPMLGQATATGTVRQPMTVGQVMDLIIKTIPGGPFPKTVDTLKSGNASQPVTGIVSTMFATTDVIEKAIAAGANFIIAHEPTFYNHADETDWLKNDPVFRSKQALLTKHGIAIWRFHDYWHTHNPDGIKTGVLDALDWSKYVKLKNLDVITLPSTPLHQLIAHAKVKLGIKSVRVVGDTTQLCQRVLLMPGASGGKDQIEAIEAQKPDVVFCGEVREWETPEYVRDARQRGQKLSLVVLGHTLSEAPGMSWLVPWLQPKVPGIKLTYIPSGDPFVYL